ncbi:head GIN domain-containing protein [Myroides fluvii]|uniref:head GIN domain-containing protein n=1 Tax=Myroides fluvii TaxID=2572594 RepID=UPI00131C1B70|nr:head GIN domain-containing protein [Myroides fluvii]
MKKIALLFIALCGTMGFAQEVKQVGEFKRVNVFDKIELTLIPDTETKMEISGTNADEVTFVNKNGNLKIRMNFTKSFQGENVRVKLHYKELDEIIAEEGATIKGTEAIQATSVAITSKTGASIHLKIDAQKAIIRAYTGATMTISGKAINQDILVNAGASVFNENLITDQTEVTVNAGGTAKVNATELVDAKTRAGGEIIIYGKPKKVNEKVVMGGSIKKEN